MTQDPSSRGGLSALLGRSFVHPVFDYMLIGGGLSLLVTAMVVLFPQFQSLGSLTVDDESLGLYLWLPYLILLSNSAHFSASTVRLYTKPGTYQALPFLTMGFPLVSLAVLSMCIFMAGRLGPHLNALYLTWSPFHYAAQAYGLAVMYSYRSGCALQPLDKRLLWWVAMLPFFYAFLTGNSSGLGWFVSLETLSQYPPSVAILNGVLILLIGLGVMAPLLLYAKVWLSQSNPMPLISILTLITNGIWFFILTPLNAFVWATIFHGVQYLAIVLVFHVQDQMARPGNTHRLWYHVVWFYGMCLLLGYGLFSCLPQAYAWAGFGLVESVLLVVATINIHHFIVDAYVWRLKKGDSNRRVVESSQLAPA